MSRPPAFLVSESETAEARRERRRVTGRSSGESFADLLRVMVPGAACELVQTVEAGPDGEPSRDLAGYDAVFLAGSPLHVYEESPAVRRQLSFMQAVFISATPCFGSCAGLQIAVAAAGGRVRQNKRGHEIGIGRRILRTGAGQDHPLLSERPDVFDALSLHSDEVEALPPGSTLLATNRVTTVQAAEICHDGGVFWGVQYHPELPLEEIADALRRQGEEIVDQKLARSEAEVEGYAATIEELGRDPGRHDLAWRLGLDEQVTDARARRSEISMFVRHLVEPTRSQRGRA